MKKKYELENIDNFIKDFNNKNFKLGNLKRISNENQENPDAICLLNNKDKIGIEATVVMLSEDEPNSKIEKSDGSAYNPLPVIDLLINHIKIKSRNDYKIKELKEIWLLISGGSYISDHDLEKRLKSENLKKKFQRIFLHDGIYPDIIEITI